MFGQMTAGSWIYIGTQGILQGTYQTFAAAGEKHFGSADLNGRTILTAGLGGMGGAQPLAGTMAGAAVLCVEVDASRIERRLQTRYLDEACESVDDALARVACGRIRRSRAVGRAPGKRGGGGSGARPPRRALRPRDRPDRRPRSSERLRPGRLFRSRRRPGCARPIRTSICASRAPRSRAMSRGSSSTSGRGSYVFDYGNNLRGEALEAGVEEAFTYPGFVPAYIRPLFCRGVGPFRWAVLSGDPADIDAIDETLRELFPGGRDVAALARSGARAGGVPGACPRGSAGLGSASAPKPAWPSTSSSVRGASRRRS